MWIWEVAEENLTIERGEGMLSVYEFGNKTMKHLVSALDIIIIHYVDRDSHANSSEVLSCMWIKHHGAQKPRSAWERNQYQCMLARIPPSSPSLPISII
jgi:hypothetical protein